MIIAGLNKLTLTDYPHKMACIVFFCGCNFRCPFCHNSAIAVGGVEHQTITCDEVLAFLDKRKGVLDGVVLSGGEPLINDLDEMVAFIGKIRAMGFKVKLDTNGSFPDKLLHLIDAGLVDYVAMDIKNSPSKYAFTAGSAVNIDNICRSVDILREGKVDYEFRTTLVNGFHQRADLEEIGRWLRGEKKYFLQSLVGGTMFDNSLMPLNMDDAKSIIEPFIPNVKIR